MKAAPFPPLVPLSAVLRGRFLLLLAFIFGATPAHALEELYSVPDATNQPATSWTSTQANDGFSYRTYDSFTLVNDAQITQVTWTGVYIDENVGLTQPPTPTTTTWRFGFYANNAGVPGVLVHSVDVPAANVTSVHVSNEVWSNGNPISRRRYTANLPTPAGLASGTTYWFSPLSLQPNYNPQFSWWMGTNSGDCFQHLTQPPTDFTRANNRAFTLSGELSPGLSLKFGTTTVASGGSHTFDEGIDIGEETSATVTITNLGSVPLTGIAASIAPAENLDFRMGSPLPPPMIPVGATETFSVIFSPQDPGSRTATLNVVSDSVPSPYVINLSGTGLVNTPPTITTPANDYYGDCDEGLTEIATFLSAHGSAEADDIEGPVIWTNDYNGTLPACGEFITVTFTATDMGGLSASTSARFYLFPPGAIWVGPATDGAWTSALNWRNGTLPTAATDTYVDFFDFQDTVLQVPSGNRYTKNLFIGQGDMLRLGDGASETVYLNVAGDTIHNEGELRLQKSTILIGGATSLTGNGQLVLTGEGTNRIARRDSSILDVLTVSPGQEITATGDSEANYQSTAIQAGLVNHGTVTADTGGMSLYQNPKVNHGVFRAINGGLLRMETPVDSLNGNLQAGAASTLKLEDTLTGGLIAGPGRLLMNTAADLIGPITLAANLTTAVEAGTTKLAGTFTNEGQILMGVVGGSLANLSIDGAVTLEGGGSVILQGAGRRQIVRANNSPADVLTVGEAQEITTTAGTIAEYQNASIHAGLVNYGTITADTGGMTLYNIAKTNLGIFRAINGGLLRLETPVDNSAGTLLAGQGSTLKLEEALTGGVVTGPGRLLINSNVGLTGPITLAADLNTAAEGGTTKLTGTVTNNSQLHLGVPGDSALANLSIDGAVTLNGSGKVVIGGAGRRQILRANGSATDVLTVGAAQEFITTAGTIAEYQNAAIHASLVNQGTITADQGGLLLYQNPKTNEGTFRAIRGGTLVSNPSLLTNYNATTDTLTGGRWEVISEGTTTTLDIQSSPIATIAADTYVCLSGANATFPQLSTLTTVAGTLCLENGKSLTTAGNLTVSGTLEFGLTDGSVNGFDAGRIVVNGNADFTGSTIHIRDRGITAGIYEIARWTGTVSGNPVLGDIPQGLNYGLLLDSENKTLRLQIIDNLPKILAIQHDSTSNTTTIDYQSIAGVAHQVRGTSDFLVFDHLPATVIGTGAVLQYLHQPAGNSDKYFYLFSSPLP
jgi:hypothetical protein